ncbi:hypothetical protein BC936DRAFT_147470 [Jimgerdemannia flammicorona]|uniref:Uncharacterized protein n=2 Tax=Jimgerdemannia flammicorona TaxID=994334 RepID=A0A433D588_9FUNG|nr:hypothetical protein BC936DRAFT_147470 [Jimgerdemannia flammicorona]RUS24820.1 hypothetical protein BC938DRAFT_473030 [Jimgerdemannia flammicorona]
MSSAFSSRRSSSKTRAPPPPAVINAQINKSPRPEAVNARRPSVESIIEKLQANFQEGKPLEIDLSARELSPNRLAIMVNFLTGRTHPFFITKNAKIVFRPQFAHVTILDLSKNNMEEHGAQYISEALVAPQCLIERLNLSSNRFGIKGMSLLAIGLINNSTLRELNVSDNWLTDKGVFHLRDALVQSEHTGLKRLVLSENNITDSGADAVSQIVTTVSLSFLVLSYNKISRRGAQRISEAITTGSALVSLNLEGNYIGPEGARELGYGICNPLCRLTTLNLSSTGLSDDGIDALAESLRIAESHLTYLNIHDCKLTDRALAILSIALRENSSLRHINLASNGFTDPGVAPLIDALRVNRTIETLNLAFNDLSEPSVLAFADAVETGNRTLQNIILSHNTPGTSNLAQRRRSSATDASNRLKIAVDRNSHLVRNRWRIAVETIVAGRLIFHAIPFPEPCLSSMPEEIKEHVLELLDTNGLLSRRSKARLIEYAKEFRMWEWNPWREDALGLTERQWVLDRCGCLYGGVAMNEAEDL